MNREEYIERIKGFVGDRTDDDAMRFVDEMITDYDAREVILNESVLKEQLEQRDNEWRRKFMERFYATPAADVVEEKDIVEPKAYKYEDLFKGD